MSARYRITGEQGWKILFTGVIVHEVFAEEGELLSEAVDRLLERYPVLIYAFTVITVLHLLNRLPGWADPYHWLVLIIKRLKGVIS